MIKQWMSSLIALALICLLVLLIYGSGLSNTPVFDDGLLTSGELFAQYGSLAGLKPRLLSYSTFVWVQEIFGEGWWKQRVANLAIHVLTVGAMWGLYREIIGQMATKMNDPVAGTVNSAALTFAIGFFALNPVAVYAVAYLIQRSILMATLFVVLGLWAFACTLRRLRWWLLAVALLAYGAAVASKEHAVMMPLTVLPLYIILVRPSPRLLLGIAGIGALLTAAIGALLAVRYGHIIGRPFDQFSKIYLLQLSNLGPDVDRNSYLLSIINQSYLFFKYGITWLIPYPGWMSIDMRPPFPVSLWTWPHTLGLLGYCGVLLGGAFMVIRYRDWRALAGAALTIPALLFVTEFSIVWVQDPFVLYRSYLWAIGIPGLIYVVVQRLPGRVVLILGMLLAGLFAWASVERVQSLTTPMQVWTDAIAKLSDDHRSVGRWFPYLNRGNIYLDEDRYREAYADFRASAALGDKGMGLFNLAAMHYMAGRYEAALGAIDGAEKQGYDFPGLAYQRGVILHALGRLEDAYRQLAVAVVESTASPQREEAMAYQGRVALDMGRLDEAIAVLDGALKIDPQHKKARLSMGMARGLKGEHLQSLAIFDHLLAEGEFGPAYYGRALAHLGLKRKAEAIADLEAAIRLDPKNPDLQAILAKVRATR